MRVKDCHDFVIGFGAFVKARIMQADPMNIDISTVATMDDIRAIEAVPLERRVPHPSTYALIADAADRFAARPAIVFLPSGSVADDPVTVSYRTLAARVTQTANLLNDLGVGPQAPVSYLLPNLPETHFVLWGGEAAGVVNPVNWYLEPRQIAEIVRAAGARVLVCAGPGTPAGDQIWEKAQRVRAQVPELETLLVIGPVPDGETGAIAYDQVLGEYPDDRLTAAREIAPDEVASLFHTGGTTGNPKLAQHRHRGEVYQAWMVPALSTIRPGTVALCGLPMFHVNAVIVTGLGPFFAGATVLLAGPQGYRNRRLIADFWRIVKKYRVTTFSGVPTLYAALLEVPVAGADITSLERVICGAAPMPLSLFRAFEAATGVKITEGYGLTEGTCVSALNPRDGERRIGSIGLRLPYQDMKTVRLDSDGRYLGDCAVDEVGVIAIRGPNVMKGYTDEAENARVWLDDGWLLTGDLARRDKDGYFWLTGRAKDLIIRGGHNIDPALIEEALHRHEAVDLAAAVGAPDAYAGERPIAYVTLREGAQATPEELRDFAAGEIPERAAIPSEIHLIDRMPVTAIGKIFKPALRFDAIARVIWRELAALDITAAAIDVGADPRHGTLARIRLKPPADAAHKQAIEAALGRFAFAWDLVGDS